jgi:CDP-diacylglycerol--glycerol-3-phosphate 3-phosphatidyltransferase
LAEAERRRGVPLKAAAGKRYLGAEHLGIVNRVASARANMPASAEQTSQRVFNVPNQLTAARLVLSIVVFVLIPLEQYLAAMIVFTIAAGTDWIDGYWARKYNQVTQLGRIFDPFVDKIIICGAFVLLAVEMRIVDGLAWYARIEGWMAVVVIGREMLVTALRAFVEQSGGDFSAKTAGKLKMVFQCAAAIAALMTLHHMRSLNTPAAALPAWLFWSQVVFVWLAVASTVYSGLEYVVVAARYILSPSKA